MSQQGPGRGGRGFGGGRGRGAGDGGRDLRQEHGGPQGGGRGGGRGGSGRGGPPSAARPLIYKENLSTALDPRLTDKSQDQLITAFKQLQVNDPARPLRPGFGTLGTSITVRANFFKMNVPKGPIYDYDVEIQPNTDIKRVKARLFELLEETPQCKPFLPHIAHDKSQRLVSAKKLPDPLVFQVPFREEGEKQPGPKAITYTILIKQRNPGVLHSADLIKYLAGDTSLRSDEEHGGKVLPLISAYNLVFQSYAAKNGVRVGKSRYFFPSDNPGGRLQLSMGIEAIQGFYASIRPSFNQLMVNVNACMTPFFSPGKLDEILSAFSRGSHGGLPTLPRHFAKIKVTTRYLGYKKKSPIYRVESTSARRTMFKCDEFGGGTISVETYFQKKYGIKLAHPDDLPVINTGKKERNIYIPAELCEVEAGQPYRGKLTDDETTQMLRFATHRPSDTADLIVNRGLPQLNMTSLPAFGVEINPEMTNIPARILPPPRISYGKGNPNVRSGSWNIVDVKFHRCATVQSWWVVVIDDGRSIFQGPQDPSLRGLVNGFAQKLRSSGVTVPAATPNLIRITLPNPQQDPNRLQAIQLIRNKFRDTLKTGQRPSFALVLLSRRDNFIYPGIKRIGDVECGVHTVHMLLTPNKKALDPDPKRQDQYFSNIALKVNTKLGGVNHTLDTSSMQWLNKHKTMIVGIDVTHPSPLSKPGTPSIAAVVASTDPTFSQYPASLRLQKTKQEMVDGLGEMIIERLQLYEKKNKELPARIIVFRDGVSEGQFDLLISEEIPQVIAAFKKFDTQARGKAYRPKLSYIVCGKRHHARFIGTKPDHVDKNGNTVAGLVVDRGVTAVFGFDFYLQAHAGLQGTVKSTHYTVVYDEFGLGPDEIQQGIHTSCYIYGRATKAVSLIPAAYYADLACERARFYLNELLNLDDNSTVSGRKADKEAEMKRVYEQAEKMWGEGLHPNMRESMFYL